MYTCNSNREFKYNLHNLIIPGSFNVVLQYNLIHSSELNNILIVLN